MGSREWIWTCLLQAAGLKRIIRVHQGKGLQPCVVNVYKGFPLRVILRAAVLFFSLCIFFELVASNSGDELSLIDIAADAGLIGKNVSGGLERKDLILETTGNGVVVFDFDGDGANDLFFPNGTTLDGKGTPSQLYHNDGHGHFRDVAKQAGIDRVGWAQGACAGDIDNDGHTDLFVTYYGHNVLYRNLGDGRFVDVTEKAKLPVTGTRWGAGCALFDYDRDGKLDIFVSNYVDLDLARTPKPGSDDSCKWKGISVMCGPRGLPLSHNALYHNNGDGTFTDVSERAGILKPGGRYSLGVVTADFDNDGWPDIYVACDMTPSLLYRNRHDGTFEERGVPAGVAYNFDGHLQAGMGVAASDFDGRGFLDIVKTNFSGDLISLYKNDDGKFFTDMAQQAGLNSRQLLGWGVSFLDVDEDGRPDLITANGHVYPEVEHDGRTIVGDHYRQKTLLFRNLGGGKFADVTDRAGSGFAASRPARGLAIGDLDGDGRPEVVIVNMNETPSLLKNMSPRRNWVRFALTGSKSNRSAIGARVTLTAGGRTQMNEVVGGGSYLSQSEFALYFGLGDSTKLDHVEVRWPNGGVEQWSNLAADRTYAFTER
jgi:hypothetical protein